MIPRTLFNQEHELFRESVRKFMEKEVAPFHSQWEKEGQVSREVWLKAGEQGFLGMDMPEEYGGSNVDFRYSTILIEEQTKVFASGVGFSLHSDIVMQYILHYGTEEQKRKYLPRMCKGEIIGAIAMTEPGTGSDLQGIQTTALASGDFYVLNGNKTFITNGFMSDLVIVVAKTNPDAGAAGISLFLVESGWEGFTKGKKLEKIGLKAQDTCELFFDNVKVPKENLLGQEGAGFFYLMSELPRERLLIAVVGIAACEVILQETIRYTKERTAFGRPIFKFQNTNFTLAKLQAEIEMGRVYVDKCIELLCNQQLDVVSAASVKYTISELQCRVMDECLQLHGGYGYIWDYPVARAYADSRVQKIYGGSNEIMLELISRSL
ncbi:MAG: acyl-CoA dehydrogenase family protein [Bacteroidia bacterium]|nr:acyl-CoA dehydrogenase family protein [Bacteroidia bacterium]